MKDLVANDPDLIGFHDLRSEGDKPPYTISFDLVTGVDTGRNRYDEVYARSLDMLTATFERQVGMAEIGIEASVDSAPMVRKQFCIAATAGK